MATYYLINTTRVGTQVLYAGSLIDDSQQSTAAIQASGGALWPSGDSVVAAAAARCQVLRAQGQGGPMLDDIMSASTDASSLGIVQSRVARGVITTIAAYTGTLSGVLTGSAVGALGAQDTGVTPAIGDLLFLPKVTGGAGGTTVGADAGPWVVTTPGNASTKFVLTRPGWYQHGAPIPQCLDIRIGGEGTIWKGKTWRSFCAPGLVIDTGDPLFYPSSQSGAGAIGTPVTGVFAIGTTNVAVTEAGTAAAIKAVMVAGNGTGTITATGTGTDAFNWLVSNF